MNNTIQYNKPYRVNQVNPSFGRLTDNAKKILNRVDVRTILKNRYGIDAKQLRKLDESPLKFALLSETKSISELKLPPSAGLMLIPHKGSMLPRTCISTPNMDLHKTGANFFAFCVKKAVEMEKLYRSKVKNFGFHPLNSEWRSRISTIERPIKIDLKKFKNEYNYGEGYALSRISKKLKKYHEQELKIDGQHSASRSFAQKTLTAEVANGWAEINNQTYINDIRRAV